MGSRVRAGRVSPLGLRLLPYIGGAGALTIAGLAAALLWTRGELADARQALDLEKAVHETDTANFRATQALANSMWLEQLQQLQTSWRSMKDETDRRTDRVLTDYRSLVRLLPSAGAAGADPGRGAEGSVPGTGLAAGAPGSGSDTVLLARADADICAINTGRLETARDWGLKLAPAR